MKRFLIAAAAACALGAPALACDVGVTGAYVRAVAPGAMATAAYMTIENVGAADRLVAARSPVARRVELHTHVMEDGVAKMREVEGGIEIPAHGVAELVPGGLHVMLMGLTQEIPEGATVPITLVFEKNGEVALDAPAVTLVGGKPPEGAALGVGAPQGHGHDHGHAHGAPATN